MVEVKTLNKKLNLKSIPLELPQKRFEAIEHLDNIEYCIEQIKRYSKDWNNYVIGYDILRTAMGTTYTAYRLLSERKAEELRKIAPTQFRYKNLDELLRRKGEIGKGKYKLKEGHIIGLSDSYLEEIKEKLKSEKQESYS